MTAKVGGFAGKILYVDLSVGEIRDEPLDPVLAEDFIGGLGLTIRIACQEIKPGVHALSPENTMVLGAGPLVGTSLPSTSRVYAVSKLPASEGIGWCGAGGVNFGYLLKNAGYDHIVIRGRAERPVYLRIINDTVEIINADTLWGKGIEETCEVLGDSLEGRAGVLCIGAGGENLVNFSMAYIDRIATLGRGGFGAVMGSKNLKAIVVTGDRGIRVEDRNKYKSLSKKLLSDMRTYPYLKEWQELGLIKSFPMVPIDTYRHIKKKRVACVSCPIGCKDVVEIQDGDLEGLVVSSSSAVNLFMPMTYGFADYREAIKLMKTLDEYGLDVFEFFGVMGFARELCRAGIISKDSAVGEINVASLDSMETWARKISHREGLGAVLAEGCKGIINEFGEQARPYAPAIIKGMHPYAGPGSALPWDMFGTMELGQVLDPRGPHVGSGGSPTYFAKRPLEVFPRHLSRMGVHDAAIARILPGMGSPGREQGLRVGTLLKYSHAWFATLGSMGICARAQINRFYDASLCGELYEAVTGIPTDLSDLRKRVNRIWTLYRLANVREGVNRNDETAPEQWFQEPGFRNYVTGAPINRQEVDQMIDDYYEEWGWDKKTGIPTDKALRDLGLEKMGRYGEGLPL